jgi:protein-S-isoprenylcysteine O-methyltransferase Ste14
MIYARRGRSIPQRTLLVVGQTVFLATAGWLLLGNGLSTVYRWFGWHAEGGNEARGVLLFALCVVVYARILFTSLYLLRRAIGWEEAVSILLAFMVYYVGFPLLGEAKSVPIDWIDGLAIGLFCVGSFINTYSELLRDAWRKKPENSAKLYTGGLFHYARHINYFGDILWVSGFALLTRNIWSALIPLLLFAFFYLYNAPELDRHLEEKYPKEFAAYKRQVKMLIPFLL